MEQPSTNTTTMTPTVRKTFQDKLPPTPAQEPAREEVRWRGRVLDTTALEQRRTWWRRGQGHSATRFQQEAELKELRAAVPESATIHSHVVQEGLARRETTAQAFFRRIPAGQTPGFPRFQGPTRSQRFTYKESGSGARLDRGFLVLSKMGRLAVRWSRPREGTPKLVPLSKEAAGWGYASISCAAVPLQPLLRTGNETGSAVGLKVLLSTAPGEPVENPRHSREAEKQLAKAHRRVSRRQQGSKRRKQAVAHLRRKQHKVQRQRRDFQHKTALLLLRTYDTRALLDEVRVANLVLRTHHRAPSLSDAGGAALRTIPSKAKQRMRAIESSPCHPPPPARTAAAVGSACPRACLCASPSASAADSSWTATSTRREPFNGPGRSFGESRR